MTSQERAALESARDLLSSMCGDEAWIPTNAQIEPVLAQIDAARIDW